MINGIAPDVPLQTILWGALPFVLCMVLAIVILCLSRRSRSGCPTCLWAIGPVFTRRRNQTSDWTSRDDA